MTESVGHATIVVDALRHAARNALVPFLALFGARLGFVFGGVIVAESVFAYPGLGQLAFDAVLARDYPVLQAVFLLTGAAVLLGNAAADLAIEHLDPRLRASVPPRRRAWMWSTTVVRRPHGRS